MQKYTLANYVGKLIEVECDSVEIAMCALFDSFKEAEAPIEVILHIVTNDIVITNDSGEVVKVVAPLDIDDIDDFACLMELMQKIGRVKDFLEFALS